MKRTHLLLSAILAALLAGCGGMGPGGEEDYPALLGKLTASDGAAGNSVAISGDYAVVGAYNDDDNGGASGSAYVFQRSGSGWTQVAKLTPADGVANNSLGESVAISDDCVIVGAWGNDSAKGSTYAWQVY